MVKKFSQFASQAGPARVGAVMVGLWSGVNTQFDFPGEGIGDAAGQFILKWLSGGVGATNYVCVTSGLSGDPALITAQGGDENVDLLIQPQADGSITLNPTQNGDINLSLGGAGDINLDTNAGKVVINSTTGIDAVLDQDDMASDSATAVPTQQSTKAYVDSVAAALSDLTFVTNTDETSYLPNSVRMQGTTNQIDATDGVLSLSPTAVFPGTLAVNDDVRINNFLVTLDDNGQTLLTTISEGGQYVGDLFIQPSLSDFSTLYLFCGSDINMIAGENNDYGSIVISAQGANGSIYIGPTIAPIPIYINRIHVPAGADVPANGGVRIVTPNAGPYILGVESYTSLSDGQLLVGSTSGIPAAANITSDNGIEVVNGSNALKLNSKLYRFQVTVNQAALAAGASVTLFPGTVSKQYKILNLWTSVGGTNFSGIGGDRNISITDNTTNYSIIPSASLLAITANQVWGVGVALPFPTVAIDTSTASGADIVAKYSGGTTDYTAGSIVISGIVLLT